MSRILVTGASGLLGLNFCLKYADQHEIVGVVHSHALHGLPFKTRSLDLSVPGAAERLVDDVRPEIILHCAAEANIDRVENNPELASRVNGEVPGEMAVAARRVGAVMLHISTDAVFDGQRGDYAETDEPHPINTYARTKLAGEQAVQAANPHAIVARVNFYGWSLSGRRSLAELFVDALSAGKSMYGFTDVFFCPLEVNGLSEILLEMAEHRLSGVYHVVSGEPLSKYDFGLRLARRFGLDADLIEPVSWQEAGLTAPRSPLLTLRCDKLQRALGHPLPDQKPGIDRFFALYQEGFRDKIRHFTD